jgi:uncharacterized membrane protein YcaP (DUF421 family)
LDLESVLRALAIYIFMLVIFRIAGRRTLGEMTSFDFVLLLFISEALQQGLVGEDFSIINAYLVVGTLVGTDILLSKIKEKSKTAEKWIDGTPIVLVRDGKQLSERMKKARVDEDDILSAARSQLGLANMQEIAYAILEKDGAISVIPKTA